MESIAGVEIVTEQIVVRNTEREEKIEKVKLLGRPRVNDMQKDIVGHVVNGTCQEWSIKWEPRLM